MEVIRVMLVDDHAVVRSGLSAFLEAFSDLKLVGEARNGQQAVELVEILRPQVVLMDLVMPVMDGMQATRLIRERFPQVQVIALTSFQDEATVRGALEAGANGYLLKNVTAEALAGAIRSVAAGSPCLSTEATRALIRQASAPRLAPPELTERERAVLRCLAAGMTNPEIARRLMISLSTVKFHVSSILSRLGAESRTEAVAAAVQMKLI